MKVLFVCSQNCLRSPTARFMFSQTEGIEARSMGTDFDMKLETLEWADTIFVMEKRHRHKIRKAFPQIYANKQIISLYIEDAYDFLDSTLIGILAEKLAPLLPAPNIPSQAEIDVERLAHWERIGKNERQE